MLATLFSLQMHQKEEKGIAINFEFNSNSANNTYFNSELPLTFSLNALYVKLELRKTKFKSIF